MEGMFKPQHSIELEELNKHVFNISKWEENISEKLANEALDTGWLCLYADFDYEEKSEKVYFSLPEDTIKQSCDINDYNDSDYDGICRDYSISYLRMIFPDKDYHFWLALAKKYNNYKSNTIANNRYWTETYVGNSYAWDEYKVPCLIYSWNDVEKQDYVGFKTEKGRDTILESDRSSEKLHKKGNLFTNRYRCRYGCKWVIGTDDLAWDYGKVPNQPFNPKYLSKPMSNVFIYQFPYEPLTKRLEPMMDQLQFAWKKYQNAMAIALPGGVAIDISTLNNIKLGDTQRIPWMEAIIMLFETSILPFQRSPIGINGTQSQMPIQDIPSTVLKSLTEYMNVISQILQMVETLTGLNPVFLGGTPTGDQAVKNTQLAYNSTMKSLQHIIDGIRITKGSAAEYISERMRILLDIDEEVRNKYESVIGSEGVQLIRMAKKRGANYGIKMIARPTDEEKRTIQERIVLSNNSYRQGQAGINSGQMTKALFMMSKGANLAMIADLLDMWEKKDAKEKQRNAMQNSQAQGAEILKQIDAQKQSTLETTRADLEKQTALQNNLSNNNINEILVKAQEERKKERMKLNQEYEMSLKEDVANSNAKI
jgi:hypothetical protein